MVVKKAWYLISGFFRSFSKTFFIVCLLLIIAYNFDSPVFQGLTKREFYHFGVGILFCAVCVGILEFGFMISNIFDHFDRKRIEKRKALEGGV